MSFFALPVVLADPCAQACIQPTSIDIDGSAANTGSTVANVSASVSAIHLLVPPGSVKSGSDSLSSNSIHHLPLFSDASVSILLKRISDLESAHTNDIKSLRLHTYM